MASSIFVLLIIQLIVIDSVITSNQTKCVDIGLKGKGYMKLSSQDRDPRSVPMMTFLDPEFDSEECGKKCMVNTRCVMAEYIEGVHCQFFHYKRLIPTPPPINKTILLWTECSPDMYCTDSNKPCRGYWKLYENELMRSKIRPPLDVLVMHNMDLCEFKCSDNVLCGYATYDSGLKKCVLNRMLTLHLEWEVSKSKDWVTSKWSCCSFLVQQLKTPEKCFFHPLNENQCKGQWQLLNGTFERPSFDLTVSTLSTPYYEDCLTTCEVTTNCAQPYFSRIDAGSKQKPSCYLVSQPQFVPPTRYDSSSINESQLYNNPYQTWQWSCCQPITYPIYKHSNTCLRIQEVTTVNIKRYSNCSSIEDNTKPFTKSLFNGFAFKLIGQYDSDWRIVSNGYQYFLVKNTDGGGGFSFCSEIDCEYYSGSFEIINDSMIISRSQWFAEPPTNEENCPQTTNLKYVVVSDTGDHSDYCLTMDDCMRRLTRLQVHEKYIQQMNDIRYNFYVGDDGRVYEGRGWHSCGSERNVLHIRVLGCFDNRRPSINVLDAVKNFIAYGVDRNFIDDNYILWSLSEYNKTLDGRNYLHMVIQNWFHFNNEYDKEDNSLCLRNDSSTDQGKNNSSTTQKLNDNDGDDDWYKLYIILPCVFAIILFICIPVVYFCKFRRRHCCPLCPILYHYKTCKENHRLIFVPIVSDYELGISIDVKEAQDVAMTTKMFDLVVIDDDSNSHCDCVGITMRLYEYLYHFKRQQSFIKVLGECLSECGNIVSLLIIPASDLFTRDTLLVFHLHDVKSTVLCIQSVYKGKCVCSNQNLFLSSPSQYINPTQFELCPAAKLKVYFSKDIQKFNKYRSQFQQIREIDNLTTIL